MSKKEEKSKPIIKKYYTILVEVMLPATLTYKVLAESPEQAAELVKKQQPIHVKHKLNAKKDKKITVYEFGSSIIKFIRNMI